MAQIYREIASKSPKQFKFPVWLSRLLNRELVEQLEWQSAGNWKFETDEARSVYIKLTSFGEFLRKYDVTNL